MQAHPGPGSRTGRRHLAPNLALQRRGITLVGRDWGSASATRAGAPVERAGGDPAGSPERTGRRGTGADQVLGALVKREIRGSAAGWCWLGGGEFRVTPLGPVLDGVLEDLGTAIDEGRVAVTRDELPEVWGDRLQLRQVVQKVVADALRYRSAVPPTIHVAAAPDGAHWTISVRDNGIGIPPGQHERIVRPFARIKPADESEGLGLGLALCHEIVAGHGGRSECDRVRGAARSSASRRPRLPRARRRLRRLSARRARRGRRRARPPSGTAWRGTTSPPRAPPWGRRSAPRSR